MKSIVIFTAILLAASGCSSGSASTSSISASLTKPAASNVPAKDVSPTPWTPEQQKAVDQKLNIITNDYSNLLRQNEAYKTMLYLSSSNKLAAVYTFSPNLNLVNGWYVAEQPVTIRLNGYKDAKSVSFHAALPNQNNLSFELFRDEDPKDGWVYNGKLLGQGDTAFWAEVSMRDGTQQLTPVLPIESRLEEGDDLTSAEPERLQRISNAEDVVKEFYRLTSLGDYRNAWHLLYKNSYADGLHALKTVLDEEGKPGTKLASIEEVKHLKEYKIALYMAVYPEVIEMNLKMSDGTKKTVQLVQDKQNRWRLIWENVLEPE